MEKIIIGELLKDCPTGTKFYSPIFGEVELDKVSYTSIVFKNKSGMLVDFYVDGKYHSNGECMLFPSKENRDWGTFQRPFKDGDVVTYKLRGSLVAFIYKERRSTMLVESHCVLYAQNMGFCVDGDIALKEEEIVFATEEEKHKLFKAIKDNGYKWNAETNTLEKLIEPKFKVGDKIVNKNSISTSWIVSSVSSEYYGLKLHNSNERIGVLPVSNQDDWELDKFDITTLNPYDRVLVRDNNTQKWTADLFSFFDKSNIYPYICVGNYTNQCIPFEGNQHLLGTTNECSEYYKTW